MGRDVPEGMSNHVKKGSPVVMICQKENRIPLFNRKFFIKVFRTLFESYLLWKHSTEYLNKNLVRSQVTHQMETYKPPLECLLWELLITQAPKNLSSSWEFNGETLSRIVESLVNIKRKILLGYEDMNPPVSSNYSSLKGSLRLSSVRNSTKTEEKSHQITQVVKSIRQIYPCRKSSRVYVSSTERSITRRFGSQNRKVDIINR